MDGGAYVMSSLQTRLARAAARDADREWRQHRAMCPRCTRIIRDRYTEPCSIGLPLRDEARELAARAREEARLDKQVPPGQCVLFDIPE